MYGGKIKSAEEVSTAGLGECFLHVYMELLNHHLESKYHHHSTDRESGGRRNGLCSQDGEKGMQAKPAACEEGGEGGSKPPACLGGERHACQAVLPCL